MNAAPATVHDAEAGRVIARLEVLATRHCVSHEGTTVCWRRFGRGRPLVLLHGGHGNWLHWVRNIEGLSRHRSLWVADLPGSGDSGDLSPDAGGDPLDQIARVLQGSLAQLLDPQERVDVAGFSFGALVAARLATRWARVRRLALLGTAGHGGTRRLAEELRHWRLPDPAQRRAALRHNLHLLMLHAPEPGDALALAVHAAACESNRFRSKPLSRAALLPPLLQRIERPVLFAWGEHDVTGVPHEIAPLLLQGRADREWAVVPGAGHWMQYEAAAATHALLDRWFA